MKLKKKITLIGLSVLVGGVIYVFLFGKLFPFSPVIIGFEKHELTNTIIYTQKGLIFNEYEKIDRLVSEVEKFHELSYRKKPKIFLFSDSISYLRRSLSTKSRMCAYRNSRIFASPWALKDVQNGKISLEIYLTHELSHTIIQQQLGMVRYPQWLLEGIAVYCSNQMGTSIYPSKSATYQLIRAGNFMPPNCFRTININKNEIKLDFETFEEKIGFIYSQFGCMVDYLITIYGKDTFLIYMKKLTKDGNHTKIFKQTFGIEFDAFLTDFKDYVMNAEQN